MTPAIRNPAWWATLGGSLASFLGALGVVGGVPDMVRAVLAGVGPLVVAVYVHEHHHTIRNQDTAAAAVAAAKGQQAAAAVGGALGDATAALSAALGGIPGFPSGPVAVPRPTVGAPPG